MNENQLYDIEQTHKDFEAFDTTAAGDRHARLSAADVPALVAEVRKLTAELAEVKQRSIAGMKRRGLCEREVIDAAKAWRQLIIGDREYRSLTLDPTAMALTDAVDALADAETSR